MPTPEQAQARGFAATSVPTSPSLASLAASQPALTPRLLVDPPEPLLLRAPPRYHLGHAVRYSGLLGLPPIVYSEAEGVPTLQVVLYPRAAGFCPPGTPTAIEVLVVQPIPASDQPLLVYGLRPSPLTDALLEQLRLMLRLDDDLGLFYRLTDQDPELRWVAACDGGRLVRAPTAFEDLVHCLVLAYGSRAQAAEVIKRLCEQLGPRTSLGRHGFPGPVELAEAPAHKYEPAVGLGSAGAGKKTRLGRSLRELAVCCASGSLHPESLRRRPSELTPILEMDDNAWQDALHEELEWQERVRSLLESLPGYRSFGIGPRAVEGMLLRLGCYDGVRLDPTARTAWERRFPQRSPAARAPLSAFPSAKPGIKPLTGPLTGPLTSPLTSPLTNPTTTPSADAGPRSPEERHAHGLLIARRIARRLSPFSIYRGLAQALLLRVPPSPRRPDG